MKKEKKKRINRLHKIIVILYIGLAISVAGNIAFAGIRMKDDPKQETFLLKEKNCEDGSIKFVYVYDRDILPIEGDLISEKATINDSTFVREKWVILSAKRAKIDNADGPLKK